MTDIIYWIEAEGAGHWFFVAFPFVLFSLFILFKEKRTQFLIPCLLISLFILNPWFYREWDKLGLYAYWRLLWIIPVIPVIAALFPCILKKIEHTWMKAVLTVAGVGLIIFSGTFVYNGDGGSFLVAKNGEKLPDSAVKVSDRLLELDENPRVIAQFPLCVYMRQYSGKIDLLYGRDIDGYISTVGDNAKLVHDTLSNPKGDLSKVSEIMVNDSYNYLVVNEAEQGVRLAEAGFEQIDTVAGYGIYTSHAPPTVRKEYNDLGQVMSVTTVDKNGNPVIGESGYATVTYDYDTNGNIVRELYTDADGIGAADSEGFFGYEREYDNHSHILMEKTLGPDQTAVVNDAGYAEVRRKYRGGNLVRESYYNENGEPVNRTDCYYAIIEMEYDGWNNRTGEQYYNASGERVLSNAGYSSLKRTFDQRRMTSEAYFDVDTKPVSIAKGYSSMNRAYDDSGKLLTESFFDTKGEAVTIDTGYSSKRYTYDESGNRISESYFNTEGKPVTITMGYSSSRRLYDEAGNRISETFYDESGNAVNNINGYCSDLREYDENRNLVRQRFLDDNGNLVVTGSGYAEVNRTFDQHNLIHEEYYDADGMAYVQSAGYAAIDQEWDGETLVSRTYLDTDGFCMNRVDGYAKAVWEAGENCSNVRFYDADGSEVEIDSLNLARDVRTDMSGWSDWLTPVYNSKNSIQNIGTTNLGLKKEGDVYTSTIEIEFKGVSATEGQDFLFVSQGSQDGKWFTGNVWNTNLIYLDDVPEDGVYSFTSTATVSEGMINVSSFTLGFRCDYWASGMYRIRSVKVEKGDTNSQWSPGL